MCETTKAIERSPVIQRRLMEARLMLERVLREFTYSPNGDHKEDSGGESRDAA